MKKFALIMPGQGSQYVGMGKELYSKYGIAKEVFDEANDVLRFDLKKLCFEGNIDVLTETKNTQPAILTASVAAFKVYMSEIGIKPICSAGHSLGELSALTCAGAISFQDALKIVRARGELMQQVAENGIGAMAAIRDVDRYVIEDVCNQISKNGKIAGISNYNSINQIVISGHREAIDMAIEKLEGLGGKVSLLKVSGAFHSPLMHQAADKFRDELMKYTFNNMDWDVISNVNALPYEGKDSIVDNLVKQITLPVQWNSTMNYLKKAGATEVIEIGPGKVLSRLMNQNNPLINTYLFDAVQDVEIFKNRVEEIKNLSRRKCTLISRSLGIAVCTQNHNSNEEEYRMGVIEPYKKVQLMQNELEREDREASIEQMKEALEMLKSVFNTKKTPIKEQRYRFNQLFEETGTEKLFIDFEMPI